MGDGEDWGWVLKNERGELLVRAGAAGQRALFWRAGQVFLASASGIISVLLIVARGTFEFLAIF